MKQMYIIGGIAALLLSVEASSANPMGMPQINFCKTDGSRPTTIACAGLEVSENGCPVNYTADGDFCLADDANAKHQRLIRNKCTDDFEMVGARCVRPDVSEDISITK